MEPQDLKRLFVDCGISVQGGDFDDEFRFADLKGDGVLTLDEFGIYYHGVLKRQAGAAGALHNIFLAYTAFGSKPDVFMDSRALVSIMPEVISAHLFHKRHFMRLMP